MSDLTRTMAHIEESESYATTALNENLKDHIGCTNGHLESDSFHNSPPSESPLTPLSLSSSSFLSQTLHDLLSQAGRIIPDLSLLKDVGKAALHNGTLDDTQYTVCHAFLSFAALKSR